MQRRRKRRWIKEYQYKKVKIIIIIIIFTIILLYWNTFNSLIHAIMQWDHVFIFIFVFSFVFSIEIRGRRVFFVSLVNVVEWWRIYDTRIQLTVRRIENTNAFILKSYCVLFLCSLIILIQAYPAGCASTSSTENNKSNQEMWSERRNPSTLERGKKKPKTNQKEAPASNYYQCHRLVMGSFRRFIFTQWHLQWPPRHLSLFESTHIVLHQLCLSTDNLQSDHLITKRDIQHNKQFRRSTIKRYEEDW